jgi:hypothetical protein
MIVSGRYRALRRIESPSDIRGSAQNGPPRTRASVSAPTPIVPSPPSDSGPTSDRPQRTSKRFVPTHR